MKTMRNVVTALAVTLPCAPMIFVQDLSEYRGFSLGTSSGVISRQVNANPDDVSVIHQTPQLVMLSKQLNGQAGAAITTAMVQDREDDPQKKIAREESGRQANLKAFRS